MVNASRLGTPASLTAAVVGPLCTPLDTLGRKIELPETRPGDLIAILQSGAYGLSASPVGFLSHPMPAEVLVDGGRARAIRARGTFAQPITPLP
jgi:diaminopimelate decarboxylase